MSNLLHYRDLLKHSHPADLVRIRGAFTTIRVPAVTVPYSHPPKPLEMDNSTSGPKGVHDLIITNRPTNPLHPLQVSFFNDNGRWKVVRPQIPLALRTQIAIDDLEERNLGPDVLPYAAQALRVLYLHDLANAGGLVRTVFSADDDPQYEREEHALLSALGYVSVEATTPRELVDLFRVRSCDLLILDSLLGDKNAMELVEAINEVTGKKPLTIMWTGNPKESTTIHGLNVFHFFRGDPLYSNFARFFLGMIEVPADRFCILTAISAAELAILRKQLITHPESLE